MRLRSHRLRSWSASRTGAPVRSRRAGKREAVKAMRATRPWTSGSRGSSPAAMRARRRASRASSGRIQSEPDVARSEEHTSELQSRFDLVCRLLLEKKKKKETQGGVGGEVDE